MFVLDGPSGGQWWWWCGAVDIRLWEGGVNISAAKKMFRPRLGAWWGLSVIFLRGCLFTDRRYFLSAEPVFFFLSVESRSELGKWGGVLFQRFAAGFFGFLSIRVPAI